MNELVAKVGLLREYLTRAGLAGVRLRGVDWFAWATGGSGSAVAITVETGVAEVLVGADGAWLLTDAIEAPRMRDEELPEGFQLLSHAWADADAREALVRARCPGRVASDRPAPGEVALPRELVAARLHLSEGEAQRLRVTCAKAAEAVTDALSVARPDWTENALAGAAAAALWQRGIVPGVVLVAGEARLPRYRHPVPTAGTLGGCVMLVVCGRRGGLWANLTRFVYFRPPTAEERALHDAVAAVEAEAFAVSTPGAALATVFGSIVHGYAAVGHPGAERDHHQGGLTGYLPREVVATPTISRTLPPTCALAWNPSLPGAKIEDTVLVSDAGLEILTVDPRWPTREVAGRQRPDILVRT